MPGRFYIMIVQVTLLIGAEAWVVKRNGVDPGEVIPLDGETAQEKSLKIPAGQGMGIPSDSGSCAGRGD